MKKALLSLLVMAATVSCQSNAQEKPATVAKDNKSEIVVDNILSRRSIRKYKPEQVSEEQLDIIMKCAINAPSAMNKQPWEVRVVQNADLLARIKKLKANFHDAPTVIVVAKDKTSSYGDFDCALLSQNIMLSANALDLGTCALGSVARILCQPTAKDIVTELNFPENYEIVLCISLGYPDESPDAKPRNANKVRYID